jgi:small-conductance mechanosensitive channel
MMQVGQIQSLLESTTTFEGRMVISGVVVLVSVVLGGVVAPYLLERVRRAVRDRLLAGDSGDAFETAGESLPFQLSIVHAARVVQLFVVILTSLARLVVWGRVGLALAAFGVLAASVSLLKTVGLTLLLVAGAYAGIGLLEEFVGTMSAESDKLDQHQGEILIRVGQVSVIIVVGLMALGLWGVEVGGLLVGAGFLGIVVGMAARQTLGAMLAGFVLMFSRPFEVGDWIEVDGNQGTVTDITIVNTRLENFDGEYVVIPNDRVSNSTIINRTRKGRLRLRIEVGIDYAADPDHAEEVAMAVMTDLDEVMAVPHPQVVPKSFGDSSVVLELRVWIDNPSSRRRWRAQSAVIRNVKAAFDREGIKIPYPQRELSGRAETGGFRVLRNGEPTTDEEAEAEPPRE